MRLLWIINPAAHKRNKYQGKIAKAQWKDVKAERRAVRGERSDQAHAAATASRDDRWMPYVARMESGETTMADLTPMERLQMPVRYLALCKSAERVHRKALNTAD